MSLVNGFITRQGGLKMRDCNQGCFRQQVRFLRRQFLQDGGLPFTNVLSGQTVEQALTAVGMVWNHSIYTPVVLGFSRSSSQRRSFLPRGRRAFDCTSDITRTAGMFPGNECVLPSQKTLARSVLLHSGLRSGSWFGRQGKPPVALERTSCLHVRWHNGVDARHSTESKSLS